MVSVPPGRVVRSEPITNAYAELFAWPCSDHWSRHYFVICPQTDPCSVERLVNPRRFKVPTLAVGSGLVFGNTRCPAHNGAACQHRARSGKKVASGKVSHLWRPIILAMHFRCRDIFLSTNRSPGRPSWKGILFRSSRRSSLTSGCFRIDAKPVSQVALSSSSEPPHTAENVCPC